MREEYQTIHAIIIVSDMIFKASELPIFLLILSILMATNKMDLSEFVVCSMKVKAEICDYKSIVIHKKHL